MRIRLVQIDGKLPNLALMKLSSYYKMTGEDVVFSQSSARELFDGDFDKVYASAIFGFSQAKLDTFKRNWPEAIVGGTGSGNWGTVEDIIGGHDGLDYSIYPDYEFSLGFSQRGCRLKCGFCVVPKKEGSPVAASRIADIWRGPGHPKKICLLDNDFFGQPKEVWRERVAELNHGGFRVCFNQGLNVRLLDEESCEALATVQYRDDQFTQRRLYTAWDNINDEGIFFRGVDMLEKAGVPPKHLMAYMLVGYDPKETRERIEYRHAKMVARRILPYVMPFDLSRRELRAFERWNNTGLYRAVKFNDYRWGKGEMNRGWEINDEPGCLAKRRAKGGKR